LVPAEKVSASPRRERGRGATAGCLLCARYAEMVAPRRRDGDSRCRENNDAQVAPVDDGVAAGEASGSATVASNWASAAARSPGVDGISITVHASGHLNRQT